LLFLIPADAKDIAKDYHILLDELRRYNPELLDKDRVIGISKSDMLDQELQEALTAELDGVFGDTPYVFFSSVAETGLMALKDLLWKTIHLSKHQ
jgi:GTP-binding protein